MTISLNTPEQQKLSSHHKATYDLYMVAASSVLGVLHDARLPEGELKKDTSLMSARIIYTATSMRVEMISSDGRGGAWIYTPGHFKDGELHLAKATRGVVKNDPSYDPENTLRRKYKSSFWLNRLISLVALNITQ